jgi:hypothetical protein
MEKFLSSNNFDNANQQEVFAFYSSLKENFDKILEDTAKPVTFQSEQVNYMS